MRSHSLVRRYLLFAAGLLLNAFGVAFVTNASLGASPIAAIPYSLSLILPVLSLGNWVILFNLGLIAAQWIIQGKEANKLEIGLEVIIAFCFGYGVDLSMLCLRALNPSQYPLQLLSLLIGCWPVFPGAFCRLRRLPFPPGQTPIPGL